MGLQVNNPKKKDLPSGPLKVSETSANPYYTPSFATLPEPKVYDEEEETSWSEIALPLAASLAVAIPITIATGGSAPLAMGATFGRAGLKYLASNALASMAGGATYTGTQNLMQGRGVSEGISPSTLATDAGLGGGLALGLGVGAKAVGKLLGGQKPVVAPSVSTPVADLPADTALLRTPGAGGATKAGVLDVQDLQQHADDWLELGQHIDDTRGGAVRSNVDVEDYDIGFIDKDDSVVLGAQEFENLSLTRKTQIVRERYKNQLERMKQRFGSEDGEMPSNEIRKEFLDRYEGTGTQFNKDFNQHRAELVNTQRRLAHLTKELEHTVSNHTGMDTLKLIEASRKQAGLPELTLWQKIQYKNLEVQDLVRTHMGAPNRTARAADRTRYAHLVDPTDLSDANVASLKEMAGRSWEIQKNTVTAVEKHFAKLIDDISAHLPEDSLVRTHLPWLLRELEPEHMPAKEMARVWKAKGARSLKRDDLVDSLDDTEVEFLTRIKQTFADLDTVHETMGLETALSRKLPAGAEDLRLTRPYKGMGEYAGIRMLKPYEELAPGVMTREQYDKLKLSKSTAQRVMGEQDRELWENVPEDYLETKFDRILGAMARRESAMVANEVAWGGAVVPAGVGAEKGMLSGYMTELIEELDRVGEYGLANNIRQSIKVSARDLGPGVKTLEGFRNVLARGLLKQNWTLQVSEGSKMFGWSTDGIRGAIKGKQYLDSHEGLFDEIMALSGSLRSHVMDYADDASDYLVPYVTEVTDAFSRKTAMYPALGEVLHMVNYSKSRIGEVAKHGKLSLLDEHKIRRMFPRRDPQEMFQLLSKQDPENIERWIITEGVDAAIGRLLHTYTGASVAPLILTPSGKTVMQFRSFSLNTAGQFKEDVLRPMWEGFRAVQRAKQTGDNNLRREGYELMRHGVMIFAKTPLYMAVPSLLHRSFRMMMNASTAGGKLDSFEDIEEYLGWKVAADVSSGLGGLFGELGSGFGIAMLKGDYRPLQTAVQSLPVATFTGSTLLNVARMARGMAMGDADPLLQGGHQLGTTAMAMMPGKIGLASQLPGPNSLAAQFAGELGGEVMDFRSRLREEARNTQPTSDLAPAMPEPKVPTLKVSEVSANPYYTPSFGRR